MAKPRRPRRASPPPMSMTSLMVIALGSLLLLTGLTWLALAYAHAGLIAALLPILPVAYGFFADQLRKSMDTGDADQENDVPPQVTPEENSQT